MNLPNCQTAKRRTTKDFYDDCFEFCKVCVKQLEIILYNQRLKRQEMNKQIKNNINNQFNTPQWIQNITGQPKQKKLSQTI